MDARLRADTRATEGRREEGCNLAEDARFLDNNLEEPARNMMTAVLIIKVAAAQRLG
jgi:hypothetical protein